MDPLLYAPLLEALAAQLPSEGFRLSGIEVEVGALLDIDIEALAAAMSAALSGVEVRVVRVAALLKCNDCGAEYPSEEHPCPVCGSPHAHLLRGEEFGITRAWGDTI